MPFPIVAVAAGLGITTVITSSAQDPPGADLDGPSVPAPVTVAGEKAAGAIVAIPAVAPSGTNSAMTLGGNNGMWQAPLDAARGDVPLAFLLNWIRRESQGRYCAVGNPGALYQGRPLETGIFQLEAPDNLISAGTTIDAMRAGCGPVGDTPQRELTSAEISAHVRAGLTYVAHCRSALAGYLSAVGGSWTPTTPGYWCGVKLIHALPGMARSGCKAAHAQLGRAPTSWTELKGGFPGIPAIDAGTGKYASRFGSIVGLCEDVGLTGM